jgi:hypothetical protein
MSNITAWEYVQQLEDNVEGLSKAVNTLSSGYATRMEMEMEYRKRLTSQLEYLLSQIEATLAVHRIEEVMS